MKATATLATFAPAVFLPAQPSIRVAGSQ